MVLEWILANKEILKIFYALTILFICGVIVLKTDRLFKLSDYQGLRYFRNAFYFYGLGFFTRFILGSISEIVNKSFYFLSIKFFFEFFMATAGFFLLYSLIWKHSKQNKKHHSFLNRGAFLFYSLAFLIATIDSIKNTNLIIYLSQIILFAILAIIGYKKLLLEKRKHKSQIYYFIIIIVGLLAWILNTILEYFLNWNKIAQIIVYSMNILFFVFFLYAIKKVTDKKNG